MISHTVYFSLGSNLGDRSLVIRQAIALLAERVGAVCRQSSLMETKPWGFESDNLFLNACVCCTTTLQPREVLEVTRRIEQELEDAQIGRRHLPRQSHRHRLAAL